MAVDKQYLNITLNNGNYNATYSEKKATGGAVKTLQLIEQIISKNMQPSSTGPDAPQMSFIDLTDVTREVLALEILEL